MIFRPLQIKWFYTLLSENDDFEDNIIVNHDNKYSKMFIILDYTLC